MGLMAPLEEARSPACSLRLCHGKQQAACETSWGKGRCSPAAAEAAAGAASGPGSLTAAPGETGSEALVVTQVPFGAFQWTGTGPESPAVIPAPQCSLLCDLAAGDDAVDSMNTAVHCAQALAACTAHSECVASSPSGRSVQLCCLCSRQSTALALYCTNAQSK